MHETRDGSGDTVSDLRDEAETGLDDTPADRAEKVVGHPRSWLGKLGLAAVASSWATNVFSGWLGFPGLVGILALSGVVAAATWIHTLDPRAPLPRYASWLFITPAACLATTAAFSSGSSVVFLTIVAAVLTVGAVLMTNDLLSVARLLEGTAFVAMGAGGIAFGSVAIAHRYALLGAASVALGTTIIAYGAAAIADRDRLVEAAKNMRFIACIPFAVAIAIDPSPRVGATMSDATRPLFLIAAIALTAAVLAWWIAIISRRRKLAAGALTAVGVGCFVFGAAFFANRAALEGMSSIALGAASIVLSVAIIKPRAVVTRIRQIVDWATKVPQEPEDRSRIRRPT